LRIQEFIMIPAATRATQILKSQHPRMAGFAVGLCLLLSTSTGCQSAFQRAQTDGRFWRQPRAAEAPSTNTFTVDRYGDTANVGVFPSDRSARFGSHVWGERGGPNSGTWGSDANVGVWTESVDYVGTIPNRGVSGVSGERVGITGVTGFGESGVGVLPEQPSRAVAR